MTDKTHDIGKAIVNGIFGEKYMTEKERLVMIFTMMKTATQEDHSPEVQKHLIEARIQVALAIRELDEK